MITLHETCEARLHEIGCRTDQSKKAIISLITTMVREAEWRASDLCK
jgi:hypothetical protein